MKKLFIMLAMCLLLSPVGQVGAAPDTEVLSTTGRITSINGDMVTVEGTGYVSTVTLTQVEDGHIYDGMTGRKLERSNLSSGMEVTAYYTAAMTRSNPPQTKSLAIITGGNATNVAKYFQVGSAEEVNGITRVLNVNGDQYVSIADTVFPYPSRITRGQELLVWYPVNALSMPAQAVAERAMNIYHDKIDIVVHLQAGVAAVNGREIQLTSDARQGNSLYLPVRAISQALGYNVEWNAANRSALVRNVVLPVNLTVGSTSYQRDGQNITLSNAPRMSGNIMIAPVEFFTQVLGATLDITNEPV